MSLLKSVWRSGAVLILCIHFAACQPTLSTPLNLSDPTRTTATPVASSPLRTAPATANTNIPAALDPTPTRSSSPTPPPNAPPSATLTPTPVICQSKQGHIETGSLDTRLLRTPLVFRVYLPPCYEQLPGKHYPVLYLFHGQSSTDDQWDRMGADETADRLIAAGEIPPLIIVMPYERYGGEPPENNFSQAVTQVLLPHIDYTYHTIPDRAHRAVGGLSRGAGWAVHFGIAHYHTFGALGAHSPAIFYSDAQYMRTMLSAIPPNQLPRIYVDIGDRDRPEITRVTFWFEALLNEYDIPHEWHLFTGYHAEEYWESHMEQYLRWYTRGWEEDANDIMETRLPTSP